MVDSRPKVPYIQLMNYTSFVKENTGIAGMKNWSIKNYSHKEKGGPTHEEQLLANLPNYLEKRLLQKQKESYGYHRLKAHPSPTAHTRWVGKGKQASIKFGEISDVRASHQLNQSTMTLKGSGEKKSSMRVNLKAPATVKMNSFIEGDSIDTHSRTHCKSPVDHNMTLIGSESLVEGKQSRRGRDDKSSTFSLTKHSQHRIHIKKTLSVGIKKEADLFEDPLLRTDLFEQHIKDIYFGDGDRETNMDSVHHLQDICKLFYEQRGEKERSL